MSKSGSANRIPYYTLFMGVCQPPSKLGGNLGFSTRNDFLTKVNKGFDSKRLFNIPSTRFYHTAFWVFEPAVTRRTPSVPFKTTQKTPGFLPIRGFYFSENLNPRKARFSRKKIKQDQALSRLKKKLFAFSKKVR